MGATRHEQPSSANSPSEQHPKPQPEGEGEGEAPAKDVTTWQDDEVTLASEQSFPASDAPPWNSRS